MTLSSFASAANCRFRNWFQCVVRISSSKRVLDLQHPDLAAETIRKIESADPRRIERADEGESFFDFVQGRGHGPRDLLFGDLQVPVFVDVADDEFANLPNFRPGRAHAELPVEVFRQIRLFGERILERDLFPLFVLARVVARLHVVLKVRLVVDFLERILLRFRRLGRIGGGRGGFRAFRRAAG